MTIIIYYHIILKNNMQIIKRTCLLLAIWCFSYQVSWSQTPEEKKTYKNAVYAELGTWTIASVLTLNYERELLRAASDGFRLNARIGVGTGFSYGSDYYALRGVLAGANMIFGKGKNRFLMSGGRIIAQESMGYGGEARSLNPLLIEMGWRYENPAKRFIAKVTGGTMGLSVGIGKTF
ncbi:MAG: hypothetical protein R8G66_32440 [Cytophagales bacterium]|nr:hypothetical protein [Cytophagales bacterium]